MAAPSDLNTLCCAYLEYIVNASCTGLPSGDELRANIASTFTCVTNPTPASGVCHNPPRILFTNAFPNGQKLNEERVSGHSVAVVGSSAYIFGGGYPDGMLSDSFWQLDGTQYPPTWVDLTDVGFLLLWHPVRVVLVLRAALSQCLHSPSNETAGELNEQ
jgi:hypothetical protein